MRLGAGNGQDANPGHAGAAKRAGRFLCGRTRGVDVIDEEHVHSAEPLQLRHRKRVPHVPAALGPVEVSLGSSGRYPLDRSVLNGDFPGSPEATSEKLGLVEASLGFPRPMKRDRDQKGDLTDRHHLAPRLSQEIPQWPGHGALASELQREERLAHAAAVAARRAGVREGTAMAAALAASMKILMGRKSQKRRSTDETVWWRDPVDRVPARATEGILAPRSESRSACGAERRKEEIEKRGRPRTPRLRLYFARRVFHRPQSAQRSCQWLWMAPQPTHRCGHSKRRPSLRARSYSSHARRISPRRSEIAPR